MVVELEEQAHAALRELKAQAKARNMELAVYLQLLVNAGQGPASGSDPSLEEFDALIEQLSGGLPLLPSLPSDFSRGDIYAGHD